LAEDAVRQWPQSGERIDSRARIGELESYFVGLRLGVGRRHVCGDTIVVEWSTDHGDGRVYRNVSIACGANTVPDPCELPSCPLRLRD
jgi:hypothetical protein